MQTLIKRHLDPDQTPHYVASDLDMHCLPMTLLQVPGKNGLKTRKKSLTAAN